MTGAVSGDAGLVPKLRFPEFEADWVKTRLGDVATVERGKFSVRPRNDPAYFGGSIPFAQTGDIVSASRYLVRYSQTLNDLGVSVSRVFPKNTIMITIAANIGDLAITSFPVAVPDSVVGIIANKNTLVEFLYSQMSNKRDELLSYATQNAQANINLQILVPLELALPTLPEQQKIAEFLAAVDARLGGLRQKRDLLAAYKRGVMQQIFTQTLRFKQDDGSAFPDWVEKRLGDVFTLGRGQVLAMPKVSTTQSTTAMYPVYSSQTRSNGLAGFFDQYLFEDAITWTTDGANAGDTKFRTGRFYCTNVCGVLQNENGNCNAFMAELINSVSKQYVSYVGNPKLMNNVMASIRVSFPHPTEQQKIADFLTALDAKTTAVTAKITQTEAFKKGLLQQMFV